MKLWFFNRPEIEETPDQQLDRALAELETLTGRPPEEVASRREARQWQMDRLVLLLEDGDAGEIRAAVEEMLQNGPTETSLRLMASAAYSHLGDKSEAIAQLGIALTLDPTFYPAHRWLAAALLARGEREAAQRVLEAGWEHRRKCLSRKELPKEREEWFGLVDAVPANPRPEVA